MKFSEISVEVTHTGFNEIFAKTKKALKHLDKALKLFEEIEKMHISIEMNLKEEEVEEEEQ